MKSNLRVFLRIVACQGFTREENIELVAVLEQRGPRSDVLKINRIRVLFSTMDRQPMDTRMILAGSASDGKKDEAVAKSRSAVDILDVSRVQTKLQAIAFFDLLLKATRPLHFSGNPKGKSKSLDIPSGEKFKRRRGRCFGIFGVQGVKIGKSARFIEAATVFTPKSCNVLTGNAKSKGKVFLEHGNRQN